MLTSVPPACHGTAQLIYDGCRRRHTDTDFPFFLFLLQRRRPNRSTKAYVIEIVSLGFSKKQVVSARYIPLQLLPTIRKIYCPYSNFLHFYSDFKIHPQTAVSHIYIRAFFLITFMFLFLFQLFYHQYNEIPYAHYNYLVLIKVKQRTLKDVVISKGVASQFVKGHADRNKI